MNISKFLKIYAGFCLILFNQMAYADEVLITRLSNLSVSNALRLRARSNPGALERSFSTPDVSAQQTRESGSYAARPL